jgi:hypothetical protein
MVFIEETVVIVVFKLIVNVGIVLVIVVFCFLGVFVFLGHCFAEGILTGYPF